MRCACREQYLALVQQRYLELAEPNIRKLSGRKFLTNCRSLRVPCSPSTAMYRKSLSFGPSSIDSLSPSQAVQHHSLRSLSLCRGRVWNLWRLSSEDCFLWLCSVSPWLDVVHFSNRGLSERNRRPVSLEIHCCGDPPRPSFPNFSALCPCGSSKVRARCESRS